MFSADKQPYAHRRMNEADPVEPGRSRNPSGVGGPADWAVWNYAGSDVDTGLPREWWARRPAAGSVAPIT